MKRELHEQNLLTPEEVSEKLKVPNSTLTQWRWRRSGPPWFKISGKIGRQGGMVRYPEDALNEWLSQRLEGAAQ